MKNLYPLFAQIRTQLLIGKLILILIAGFLATTQTNAQNNGTNPLDVSDLSFTPSIIDTSANPETVTVTIRVTDTITDVTKISVNFRSSTGNQFVSVPMNSQNIISGDTRDGVYQAKAIFPQNSRSGLWNIFEIITFDNFTYRNFYGSDLAARNFPTELQVISINEDVKPPELLDFSLNSLSINTSDDSRQITVTVRAADTQVGIRNLDVHFQRGDEDFLYPVSMNLVSGSDKDGIYKGVIVFSQNTPPGTYSASVYLSDILGNRKYLPSEELSKFGFAADLQIVGSTIATQPTQKSRKRARFFQP